MCMSYITYDYCIHNRKIFVFNCLYLYHGYYCELMNSFFLQIDPKVAFPRRAHPKVSEHIIIIFFNLVSFIILY